MSKLLLERMCRSFRHYINLNLFLCRFSRADAAKKLLDLGANANAQDVNGRTPLHAAVAADAMGVFQVSFIDVEVESMVCIWRN